MHIEELRELARSAGLVVTGTLIQRVASIHPRHILGKGKLAELEVLALQGQASLIIFDGELTPAQLNEPLRSHGAQGPRPHATHSGHFRASGPPPGRANCKWKWPSSSTRNPVSWARTGAMDRLMGGIGGRGPGETKQLETDRRRVRERIARIKR